MFGSGTYIKVIKLGRTENPICRTPSVEEYTEGVAQPGISVPVDYEVTGDLIFPIQEGDRLSIARDTRNGKPCTGTLQTSAIQKVEELNEITLMIETHNSVYHVTQMLRPVRSESGESQLN
jgi:hypothetical protein